MATSDPFDDWWEEEHRPAPPEPVDTEEDEIEEDELEY